MLIIHKVNNQNSFIRLYKIFLMSHYYHYIHHPNFNGHESSLTLTGKAPHQKRCQSKFSALMNLAKMSLTEPRVSYDILPMHDVLSLCRRKPSLQTQTREFWDTGKHKCEQPPLSTLQALSSTNKTKYMSIRRTIQKPVIKHHRTNRNKRPMGNIAHLRNSSNQ